MTFFFKTGGWTEHAQSAIADRDSPSIQDVFEAFLPYKAKRIHDPTGETTSPTDQWCSASCSGAWAVLRDTVYFEVAEDAVLHKLFVETE